MFRSTFPILDIPLNCLKLEKERGKLAHCFYRVGNWAKSRGSCSSGESGMLPSGTKTNFSAKVEQNDVWIRGVIRNFLHFNVPLTPFIITYNLYNYNTKKKMNRNRWKVIRLFRTKKRKIIKTFSSFKLNIFWRLIINN